MKANRRPPTALLLAAPLLAGLSLLEPLARDSPPPAESSVLFEAPSSEIRSALDRSARAVREGDFAGAREALVSLDEGLDRWSALEARVLLGLFAHATGEWKEALELLDSTAEYDGRLADWRLWAAAASAEAEGRLPGAQQAWAHLLERYPASPLRWDAYERAVGVAVALDDDERALDLIRAARAQAPDPELAGRLEELAWDLTEPSRDAALRRELARQLLVERPILASQLAVVEELRLPDGRVEWDRLFSPEELARRAANLLDADVQEGAIEALESIRPADRDTDWHLLMARAEIDSHRGVDALPRLESLQAEGPRPAAEREWLLARACLDASRSRRGRVNLPPSQREEMRARADAHLWRLAEELEEADLGLRALQVLVARLDRDSDPNEARRSLAALRDADPEDSSGADFFWDRGWEAYERRDFHTAIRLWGELSELYPYTSAARGGRYWSARAFDRLGEGRKAQDLYREVAAVEVDDFYRRHALRYLEGAVGEPRRLRPDQDWPYDALLDRAHLLSELGLDAEALIELDGMRVHAERRAADALEAIVLARQSRRRESIRALRRAFPALGTVDQNSAPPDALRMYYPLDFQELIAAAARTHGVKPTMIQAMVRQESAFDTTARSHAGARGLMQVMPATGRELARKMGLPFDTGRLNEPGFSVQIGTAYYRQVLGLFEGNEELALAGYNGGPYRIRRLWRRAAGNTPIDHFVEGLDIPETRIYVKRVLLLADSYRRLYG